MSQAITTVQIRPDSSTPERLANLYGWFRTETLVGRAKQLDKMPASEALSLARQYVAMMPVPGGAQ